MKESLTNPHSSSSSLAKYEKAPLLQESKKDETVINERKSSLSTYSVSQANLQSSEIGNQAFYSMSSP